MPNQDPVHYYPSGELELSPYCQDVWKLLCGSAEEFVPPLNQRSSTVQQDLVPGSQAQPRPTNYFEELKSQAFLLYVEKDQVLGFLSFRPDYVAEVLHDPTPCAYVSTIVVRKDARRRGVTSKLYDRLLKGEHHQNSYVSTRTWSENRGHIALLEKKGFDLQLCIPNDRGDGIDTVYFRKAVTREEEKQEDDRDLTLWQRFKAYKLDTSVYAVLAMVVASLVFVWMYLSPRFAGSDFVPELALAIATSLLASIFCLVAEMYIDYRSRRNDKLLEGLHAFGIQDLHFDKQRLLLEKLESCSNDIWISGCRLILTRKIVPYMVRQVRRYPKLEIRILLCPPWSAGYQLVYGEDDHVMDNYFSVLRSLQTAYGTHPNRCHVHLIEKPLFSDTYKFDKDIVTGPYLHAKSKDGGRITANDFFTYNVVHRSHLQVLMEQEYATLWDESAEVLDWDAFRDACRAYSPTKMEEEKTHLLRSACRPIRDEAPLLPEIEAEYAQ